jgi:hypothetical protein
VPPSGGLPGPSAGRALTALRAGCLRHRTTGVGVRAGAPRTCSARWLPRWRCPGRALTQPCDWRSQSRRSHRPSHGCVSARPQSRTDRPSRLTVISSGLKGLASLGYLPAEFASPRFARLAMTTSQGASIYLAPTEAGACLLDSSQVLVATCASLSQIAAAGAVEFTICSPDITPTDIEIGGIVPDGVADPRVIYPDGSSSPLHVENNAFVLRVAKTQPLPVKIAWSLHGKRVQAPLPIPADASHECLTATRP